MPPELWTASSAAAILVASLARYAVALVRDRRRERILIVGMTPLTERIVGDRNGRARGAVLGVVDDCDGRSEAVPLLGPLDRLAEVVERLRPHRVVVALAEWRRLAALSALLEACVARGLRVEGAADCYERLTGRLALDAMTPPSLILSGHFRVRPAHRWFARALSLIVAAIGLVCALPLALAVALAIKLDSPGPIFFRQARTGLNGRPFTLIKFRTMQVCASSPRSEWAADNENRITRVGRWLRRLRIDELPQFVNMLRGEMNLIGPRPHPVRNFELLTLVARNLNDTTGARISYYHLRTMVPPGLTGWAQVRFRYANDLDEEMEKLQYDLYYVKHASIGLDLRILVETCRLLFSQRLSDGATRAVAAPVRRPAVRTFPLSPSLANASPLRRDATYGASRRS